MDYHTLLKQLHNGEIHEVYFFYGEEKLLLDKALKALEKQILPEGLEDFNKDVLSGADTSPKQIAELAMNLPFMAERRLLIIQSPLPFLSIPKSDKAGQASVQYLLEYLESPNPQCTLVFCAEGALGKTGTLNKKLQEIAFLGSITQIITPARVSEVSGSLLAPKKTAQRPRLIIITALTTEGENPARAEKAIPKRISIRHFIFLDALKRSAINVTVAARIEVCIPLTARICDIPSADISVTNALSSPLFSPISIAPEYAAVCASRSVYSLWLIASLTQNTA